MYLLVDEVVVLDVVKLLKLLCIFVQDTRLNCVCSVYVEVILFDLSGFSVSN